MQRCKSGLFLAVALPLLLMLAGCAGKSSNTGSNDAIQSITLSPSGNLSVDIGSSNQTFTATAHNGIGQVVPVNVKFATACAPDIQPCTSVDVANDGHMCAGTWDSRTNPGACTPGTAGVAQVTAVAGGISSPPATVYVHEHIDNMTVSPTSPPLEDCFSLGDPDPEKRTATYQATAFSNRVDITNSVGPISWTATNANVVTMQNNSPPVCPAPQGQPPCNQVKVTAKTPGITNLIASVSGANSSPVQFTTCLVNRVMLRIQNGSGNTINFTNSGSQTIEATVFDTLNNPVSSPPLTWGNTNPLAVKLGNTTSTNGTNTVSAKTNLGGSDVFAACEPPSCNIGVLPGLPVYSTGGIIPPPTNQPDAFGAISVNVTNSKIPTYSAWAASTQCYDLFDCDSVAFAINPGNTPIGSAVFLPRTPNSIMFTPAGDRLYIGSNQGLMFLTGTTGNASLNFVSTANSPCNVIVCGKVLAISPDGNRVVVSDTVSNPNHAYIFSSSGVVDLLIDGAAAATFSPDGFKLFIVTSAGKLFVFSTIDALQPVNASGAPTDIAFSADGSFAYIAGLGAGNQVSGFATCNGQDIGDLGLPGTTALRVFPLSGVQENAGSATITQQLLALEPPNIQFLDASYSAGGLGGGQFKCNPPGLTLTIPPGISTFNLGQGNFTPLYVGLGGGGGPFGQQVVVVAQNVPAVMVFDVNSKTTTAVPLVGGGVPLAASSSPDGTQIYVATCDQPLQLDQDKKNLRCFPLPGTNPPGGEVHIVNAQTGGDIEQVPFFNPNTQNSMCSNLDPVHYPCVPDLIAVQPK
jgi:hypothetical protein